MKSYHSLCFSISRLHNLDSSITSASERDRSFNVHPVTVRGKEGDLSDVLNLEERGTVWILTSSEAQTKQIAVISTRCAFIKCSDGNRKSLNRAPSGDSTGNYGTLLELLPYE